MAYRVKGTNTPYTGRVVMRGNVAYTTTSGAYEGSSKPLEVVSNVPQAARGGRAQTRGRRRFQQGGHTHMIPQHDHWNMANVEGYGKTSGAYWGEALGTNEGYAGPHNEGMNVTNGIHRHGQVRRGRTNNGNGVQPLGNRGGRNGNRRGRGRR